MFLEHQISIMISEGSRDTEDAEKLSHHRNKLHFKMHYNLKELL